MLAPWKKSYDKPRQCIKKQRHHFADKSLYGQSYGFSRSHVQMWELDHKEGSAPKNWCFQITVLEKTLESPLDGKIKPVTSKGNQPWIFIGRTDDEAEASVLWPPDAKSQLIGKHSDSVKDWSQRSGQQRIRWLNSITDSMDMCGFHIAKDRGTWHATIHSVVQTQWLSNIILNGEKLKAFPLRSRARQRCPLSPLLFNTDLKVLTMAIRRERNSRNSNWKRIQTRIVGDIILYIENPKDAIRELLEFINEFSKVAGYKVNSQKSLAFLCTNNERSEEKLRKKKSHLPLHQKDQSTWK